MTRPPPVGPAADEGGTTPDLAAAFELAAIGAGLTVAMVLAGRLPSLARELAAFQILFVAAFGLLAIALLRRARYARLPHVGAVVFGIALAMRAALWPSPPALSDDVYRYVWEGRVVAHGGNPYRQAPVDSALAPLRDARIYPFLNFPQLSTIYPPLAEAGFALVARVSATVAAMKLWVIAHDLATVALLLAWLRRRGAPAILAIAYAWNPLVVIEFAGSGHNDATALPWMVLAFLWAERRPIGSALALAVAVLVKLAPLAALPWLWRDWPWRARLVALAVLVPGLVWFWLATRVTYSGLAAYWGTWRNNELLFHYLSLLPGGFTTARTLGLVLVALLGAWLWWSRPDRATATRQILRAGLLTSPVLHPWYLAWALVFEPLRPSALWLLLSCTAVLNYGWLTPPGDRAHFHAPLAWRWIEYGLPLALALALAAHAAWRRSRAEERRV